MMLSLFPEVGVPDELEGAFPRRQAHDDPIQWHNWGVFHDMPKAAALAGNGASVGKRKVADKQTECRHGKNGARKKRTDGFGALKNPDADKYPVKRAEELGKNRAPDQ